MHNNREHINRLNIKILQLRKSPSEINIVPKTILFNKFLEIVNNCESEFNLLIKQWNAISSRYSTLYIPLDEGDVGYYDYDVESGLELLFQRYSDFHKYAKD